MSFFRLQGRGLTVVAALSFTIALGGWHAAPAYAEASATSAVTKIADRFVADGAGVLTYRSVMIHDERAPGHNEHDERDISYLQQDRRTLAAHIHRYVDKGHEQNPDELAKTQDWTDKQIAAAMTHRQSRFAFPYLTEWAADYTFESPVHCTDCAGAESIAFKSALNDARHGRGTMMYDPTTFRLIKVEFIPNVFPKYVTEAKMTYTYGRHDDGSWGLLQAQEHYLGRMMMISGGVEETTTVSKVRHFATVDEGRRSLSN